MFIVVQCWGQERATVETISRKVSGKSKEKLVLPWCLVRGTGREERKRLTRITGALTETPRKLGLITSLLIKLFASFLLNLSIN